MQEQTPSQPVSDQQIPTSPVPVKQNNKPSIKVAVLVFLLMAGGLVYLGYQNSQLQQKVNQLSKQQTDQGQPTLSPTTSPTSSTPDQTANWETYTNQEKGYSIKYAKEGFLRLICPGEELTVTNDGVGGRTEPVQMATCARGGRYTLETKTYDTLQVEPQETQYYTIEKKNVILGGLQAKQYIYTFTNIEEGPFPQWYTMARVNRNGKTYEIYFDEKDSLGTFDKILSTFKFLN